MVGQTILIIDDTPDHRDILCRLLLHAGYRVIVAGSAAEGLELAQHEQPDLMLVALALPGQSGWQTTQQLRAEPRLAAVPILGTTVYTTLLTVGRARALGCVDVVAKPFDLDSILGYIARLMPGSTRPLALA